MFAKSPGLPLSTAVSRAWYAAGSTSPMLLGGRPWVQFPMNLEYRASSPLAIWSGVETLRSAAAALISNGEEARYSNFIGNCSQGLPHNSIGEVEPAAYQALLTAVDSGNPGDFANIPLGGNVKFSNPQGGLAFDLEGTDCAQMTIPPAPRLASARRAGEMVEDYWMAMARDIPFSQYGAEPLTTAAIADLNRLSDFAGPKVNGQVTAA